MNHANALHLLPKLTILMTFFFGIRINIPWQASLYTQICSIFRIKKKQKNLAPNPAFSDNTFMVKTTWSDNLYTAINNDCNDLWPLSYIFHTLASTPATDNTMISWRVPNTVTLEDKSLLLPPFSNFWQDCYPVFIHNCSFSLSSFFKRRADCNQLFFHWSTGHDPLFPFSRSVLTVIKFSNWLLLCGSRIWKVFSCCSTLNTLTFQTIFVPFCHSLASSLSVILWQVLYILD